MDQAQKWRKHGRCIISGFHSPIEKECLYILLRGSQPIVICPARSLERMRIPVEWRESIVKGRLLLLSPFDSSQKRLLDRIGVNRILDVGQEFFHFLAHPFIGCKLLVLRIGLAKRL